jgi:UDP-N-acetylmuramoyl-L-alanyl-D-glutamate--2,6-diaminopimelate ligase
MSAMAMRLSHLLQGAGVRPLVPPGADPKIEGTALDSTRVGPGGLFFAIKGFRANGEDYAPDAVRRGARAVVAASPRPEWVEPEVAWVQVEQPRQAAGMITREYFGRPDEALTLIGITGTNGKTTVAYLVEAIASAAGRRVGRIGTVSHSLGNVELAASRTTPEAPEFYLMLAQMLDASVDTAVMEVSSHALTLSRVEGAHFAAAVFLNLGRDHLEFHGGEQNYFDAKARLFENLSSDQIAVLPADTSHGEELARRTDARVTTFGRSAGADVRLAETRSTLDGSSAILETGSGTFCVETPLLGEFNLDNVAAAAACALALGLPAEAITDGVPLLKQVPGRMETIDQGQGFKVIVDYAHTPDALANLLGWTQKRTQGDLIVLFGCGGERDRAKRFDMGKIAAENADRLFLTSDNPREESPGEILDEIAAGVAAVADGTGRANRNVDRREAIHAAIESARPGDVVILAGKGHETTQTIGNQVLAFDDRTIAIESLERLGFHGSGHADA